MEDEIVVFLRCCFGVCDDGEMGFKGFRKYGEGVARERCGVTT